MKTKTNTIVYSFFTVIVILTASFFLPGSPLFSQSSPDNSSNRKLFQLKKAELSLKELKSSYEMALESRKNGLISEAEFSQKYTAYLKGVVDYQEALIEFSNMESRLIVEKAVKWIDPNGRPHARVEILYSSRDIEALHNLGIKEDLFPLDFLKEIKDIYISLYSEDFVISDPYQARIPSLKASQRKSIDFRLLKDVEQLQVSVFYAGKQDNISVFLLKDSTSNVITMQSSQFSQEVGVGGEASFDLSLERFTRVDSVFKLHILGLPTEIGYEFLDTTTGARLSQIKFPEGLTSLKLTLKTHLPSIADKIAIDKPIDFYALCLDEKEFNKLENSKNFDQPGQIIKDIKGGVVKLEIIPRGTGKIELEAANLYMDIKTGDIVTMKVTAINKGTLRLNSIKPAVDVPLDWKWEITPDVIRELEPGKKYDVNMKFTPPTDISIGDYEIKIKAVAFSAGTTVESDSKLMRIHVESPPNVLGTALLVIFLIGLVATVIVFGIKITRK